LHRDDREVENGLNSENKEEILHDDCLIPILARQEQSVLDFQVFGGGPGSLLHGCILFSVKPFVLGNLPIRWAGLKTARCLHSPRQPLC
jgi:hypothetical protein